MKPRKTKREEDHVDVCDRCGLQLLDIDVGFCLSLQRMGHAKCAGTFRKRSKAEADLIPPSEALEPDPG